MTQYRELVSSSLGPLALGAVAVGLVLFLLWSLGGVIWNPDAFPAGRF